MKMMTLPALWAIVLLLAPGGGALIIADNLVSLMHVFYSATPIIRTGTDSRLGFGFRFGPHADAQVILELGPQRRTSKLTTVTTFKPDVDVYAGKRHVGGDLGRDPLLLRDDEHRVDEVADNHLRAGKARALADRGGDATGGRGGEWLTRWRSGWGVHGSSAPTPAPMPAPTPSPSRASRGLGMRIQLASTSTTLAPPTSTVAPRADPDVVTSAPRRQSSTSRPTTTTASHLRDAMAVLSSRTTRTPTPPAPRQQRQVQGQARPGIILQVLRQLWEAGANRNRGW